MTAKFETNVIRNIYDNDSGCHMTVRPDVDGLGLVEIDGREEFGGRIAIQPEMEKELARAILACAAEIAETAE